MNTQQARTQLLDSEWIVAIQDEIDRQPEHISEVIEAELMGRFDAEMGKPATPYEYYAKAEEVDDYLCGYNEATAALAGLRLAAMVRLMMGEEEYMAAVELADLREGMADTEWHRGGQW